jgi:hypothetical protein
METNQTSALLRTVNREIEDFKSRSITIVPGLTFNQYDTIQTIHFYYNSKFKSGDTDDEGDRKYFLNINRNPCKVFSKAIDFDTKNIRLLTVGGGDPLKTWFMERDLKYWMRDQQFGKTLNRIFTELPIYGSVVLKIVDGVPYFVDLRNFALTQSADTISGANFVTETHNYSVSEFRKVAKQMGWADDKVKEVIQKFYQMKDTSHIRLLERYGDIETTDGDYKHMRLFIADVGIDEYDQNRQMYTSQKGVELKREEWEGHPYWEFHAEKVPGRWLGIGVVETLIEPQIRVNEVSNLQSKAAYWTALRLWQTRDPAVARNLLTDARNGEVLSVDSEITKVDMSNSDSAYFDNETAKWMRNRDEMTFSYDVVQGERLPAGTPLGSAKLAVTQTLSYFEQIQENVAMDVKEMLFKVIIPRFQTENTKLHTLRLVGKDLDQYVALIKNELVLKEVIRQATMQEHFPTEDEKDAIGLAIESSIKQGKEHLLDIPKGFYEGIKYDVDIDITGESVDTRVRSATRFAILQAITSDPTMLQDPVKKNILVGMAEDGGISPSELFNVEEKSVEQMVPPTGRAGGGVSAPAMGAAVPGQNSQTI